MGLPKARHHESRCCDEVAEPKTEPARPAGVMVRLGGLTLIAILIVACGMLGPSPTAPSSVAPSPSQSPTLVLPSEVCIPETGPVAPAYAGDPCPGAFATIRAAVASYEFRIKRIYVEAGPFFCGALWPPVTLPLCSQPIPVAGMDMRAWVSFVGTPEVAAIALARPIPPFHDTIPVASPMAWTAHVLAFTIPPAGWRMP